jgi:hypothetical protein
MKICKTHRGHETDEHRALKGEVLQFLRQWGYGTVLCEHQNCDVVAVQPHKASILGVEVERSNRNVLKNLSRNFSQGCEHVLIVCPDFHALGQVARKLARDLSPEFGARTALATISALRLLRPFPFPGQGTRNSTTKGNYEPIITDVPTAHIGKEHYE